jgi:hypothetical protein
MAEVAVQVYHYVIVMIDGPPQARDDGGTKAQLAGTMQTAQSRVASGILIAPSSGAVRRLIIDNEQVNVRCRSEQLIDQLGQVVDFVVGGDAYQDSGRISSGHWRRRS